MQPKGYIAILSGSLILSTTSVFASTVIENDHGAFLVNFLASVILYSASLTSLSFSAAENRRLKDKPTPHRTAVIVTGVTGFLATIYVLILPFLCPSKDTYVLVALRIPTGFYACKLLDLTVARAHKPPVLRHGQGQVKHGLAGRKAHATYVWKALTEMRYKSFDIAVDESRQRQRVPTSPVWTYGPPLVLLPLMLLFPDVAELQILTGLLGLQLGLEGLHTLLHPTCPNWLFWQPFAAGSLTEFWGLRWHRGAGPFLHGLGYTPARKFFGRYSGKDAGRTMGVLSAFSLSGIWHAWGGASLTRDEHVWAVSVGLWAIFVLQGVGILAEGWLLKDDKWRRGKRRHIVRVLGWLYSVETASIWLRYALPRRKLL